MKFLEVPRKFISFAAWNNERARFNHDWLQVSFLTFLQAWHEEIDSAGKDRNMPADLDQKLRDWSAHRPQLDLLLREAKRLLSPARLVEAPPLDSLPERQRAWLAEVVEAVWSEQSGVALAVADLTAMANEVDGLVEAVCTRQPAERAGARLYESCRRISHALSSLPSAGAVL